MQACADARPLVAHLVYRFDTGGLENGVVNLINHGQRFRHVVVALTEVAENFSRRVQRQDVAFFALHKPPGHALALYPRLYRLWRRLRPAVVHTRNLAALECQFPALAAGVPVRIHGEHGRDVTDVRGDNRRHQWARRIYSPAVQCWVPLSRDLQDYLVERVGIAPGRIERIYNGVDTQRFDAVHAETPSAARRALPGCPFQGEGLWCVGTVGRMQAIKDQTLLAEAFVRALKQRPALRSQLRLVMVGDGPLRTQAQAVLQAAGVAELAWLPGERADVPAVMRALDVFALPSLAEGISNTILEAMASGVAVLATDVGGNAELVADGVTGHLVPAADADAMAAALLRMADGPQASRAMGAAGRAVVEQRFSLQAMVAAYENMYRRLLLRHAPQLVRQD